MKDRIISLPELALIAGTRAIAGAGVGLLLADRLEGKQRRAVGWALLAVGALTTIPLAAEVLRRPAPENGDAPNGRKVGGAQRVPTSM